MNGMCYKKVRVMLIWKTKYCHWQIKASITLPNKVIVDFTKLYTFEDKNIPAANITFSSQKS